MPATIPRLEDHLPDLIEFVRAVDRQIETGELQDGDGLVVRIRDFYSADRMAAIESVAPGWQDMAAYAEGLNILRHANVGKVARDNDAETTPLREPKYYQYDIDIESVAEVWRRGSVVASWLLDLTAAALVEDPQLETFAGRVSDSGEGRWTSLAAIDIGAPAPILTTSLYERFTSRGEADYADKLLSAMRKQFGGHDEKPASGN